MWLLCMVQLNTCAYGALFSLFPFHSLALFLTLGIARGFLSPSPATTLPCKRVYGHLIQTYGCELFMCECVFIVVILTETSVMYTYSDECICMIVFDFFLCHTASPSVTSFYVYCVCIFWYARTFVVCVFRICNFFFRCLSTSLSIYRSLAWSLWLFFFLTLSLFQHNIWIYLIFRKRIMRPMNFFFRFFNIISFLCIQFVIT